MSTGTFLNLTDEGPFLHEVESGRNPVVVAFALVSGAKLKMRQDHGLLSDQTRTHFNGLAVKQCSEDELVSHI